jgi:preprotein translocase subunit SecE
MPTRKETAKRLILIPSGIAYNIITRIKSRLNSDKLQKLNYENKDVVEQINKVIAETRTTLSTIPSQLVTIEGLYSLDKIEMLWIDLNNSYKGEVTAEFKNKYKESLQITKDFFNSLSVTPAESHQTVSFRNKSTEEEQARLESLSKRRLEVKQLYEKALKEVPINEEKVQKLREQLEALGETYIETKKNLDGIKNDSAEEVRMRKRIDDAFDFLSKDNHLEKELAKLQWEFYAMLVLIALTVIVFIIFYGAFLYHLNSLALTSWCEYLPYTMSVPIAIGLLWLFVYLKNRASKISIEISSRLYDIRYMEGLMKMTNSMSRTGDEASQNIEVLIRSMVDSFLNKMSDKSFKEKELSIIEKQELENSPYWKVLNELKDLVNLIKK